MFIPAGGHLLNAVAFGGGPRTFLAHGGWVGSWELWQQPFELMQDHWRCISSDHRGSGASTAPADEVNPQGLVDDLFAVLDHYAVDRCVVAGESMGALTVIQAVLSRPARFEGLVLVDAVTGTSGRATDRSVDFCAVQQSVEFFQPGQHALVGARQACPGLLGRLLQDLGEHRLSCRKPCPQRHSLVSSQRGIVPVQFFEERERVLDLAV